MKVSVKNSEGKSSQKAAACYMNGVEVEVLAPGESHEFDVTLGEVLTVSEVKLQVTKGAKAKAVKK